MVTDASNVRLYKLSEEQAVFSIIFVGLQTKLKSASQPIEQLDNSFNLKSALLVI
jgi:hypothetical protein